jgi:hypothetical protein
MVKGKSVAHFFTLLLLTTWALQPGDSEARHDPPQALDVAKHGPHFWIGDTGPSGPLFSGPQQYPFICTTVENGLGQPLVDNDRGIGNAVFPEIDGVPDFSAEPVGYSRLCRLPTRVNYFYYSTTEDEFLPIPDRAQVPPDVKRLQLHGHNIAFIVRLELGTINRFLYSIAMLAPYPESLESPRTLNNKAWNGKLVYKFQGGTGIGHQQGSFSLSDSEALHYESLERGYAVAYSTGTRTGTHYNLRLAEETALMVKAHFRAIYGKPKYTVGIGGSGGAVAQHVIGQNNPLVIDAAIAQLSYPDMISQVTYVADCEPLERYFDAQYSFGKPPQWGNWLDRQLIEGLNTSLTATVDPWSESPYAPRPGSSECVNGWRGSVQSVMNPAWTDPRYVEALERYRYPPKVIADVKWTHWNDLANIYPQDEDGFAPNTWDNVGVQYGLRALRAGSITPQEFLDLNACVGGWKSPQEMVLGAYPWNPDSNPATLDPWDQRNMNLSPSCKSDEQVAQGPPAPRTEGSVAAMRAAYASGHVFKGRLDIPVLDIRYYLEPILDMHHAQASFATRARMIDGQGHADNQVIWIVGCNLNPETLDDDCPYDPTGDALDVIDTWITRLKHGSARWRWKHKPEGAVDKCFRAEGAAVTEVYAGADAWDGVINEKPQGPCAAAFPIYSTSRVQAGENFEGDIFKCALKPVAAALQDGTYGDVEFSEAQRQRLGQIFPTGVCDYRRPDVGKPWHWGHRHHRHGFKRPRHLH